MASLSSNPAARNPVWALLALSVGAFGIGTTEFAPMGMLPAISSGIDVSIPVAGQLVTAYAVGVMLSAPVMTLVFGRFRQRPALMLLMGIFILGNLISALAPGYWMLLVGRLVTSMSQGAFFGIGAVVAMKVAPEGRQASAVATLFMGLSIANIGGVPAAAWLGDNIGWRLSFAITAGIGVLAFLAIVWGVPQGEPGRRANVRGEIRALIRPQMLVTLVSTVLFAGGFFAVYTYVAPILRTLAGAQGNFVMLVLMLVGIGLTAGNWLGGKLADWSLEKGAAVALGALALTSLLIPLWAMTGQVVAVGFIAWSVAAFACVPALQMRAIRAAEGAPSLAAAFNIAAFNFGNALGAVAGGAAIGVGMGYASVPVIGALLVLVGLAVLLAVGRRR